MLGGSGPEDCDASERKVGGGIRFSESVESALFERAKCHLRYKQGTEGDDMTINFNLI